MLCIKFLNKGVIILYYSFFLISHKNSKKNHLNIIFEIFKK